VSVDTPLSSRLALLSRQSGRAPVSVRPALLPTAGSANGSANIPGAAASGPCAPTLAERLQRMSLRAHAFERPTDDQLAERLGGRVRAPGLIEIECRHPLDQPHGLQSLASLAQADLCWLTGGSSAAASGPHRSRRVFIDTETTGLAGGTGTVAFLVGVAWVAGESLLFTQWLMTRFAAEGDLLDALLTVVTPQIEGPVEWVSFNGKSFDLPLLATRLQLARRPDTISGRPHHDLLHPTRTAFGRHWPDCRLQTAEQRLLGVHRQDDLPGHRIPAVWADFVQFGDASELAALVEHNRIDLLSLAALLPALCEVYLRPRPGDPSGNESVDVAAGSLRTDAGAIARMQVRRRRPTCARAHLTASESQLDASALLQLAALHRVQGDWQNAIRVWQGLYEQGSLAACESLAKYHEHVARDLHRALVWCDVLCLAVPGSVDHQRRRLRLLGKLGQHAGPDLFTTAPLGQAAPGPRATDPAKSMHPAEGMDPGNGTDARKKRPDGESGLTPRRS